MFNKGIVLETLMQLNILNAYPGNCPNNSAMGQDKEISLLIYEIFGGEILKTRRNKVWHFYNRINGKREDCSELYTDKTSGTFDDFLSDPDETQAYFDSEDYLNLYFSFLQTFEKIIGLKLPNTTKSKRHLHLMHESHSS
jgi:hypothetical protein